MLNETNITIEVLNLIVESKNPLFIESLKDITPLVSVIATIIMAIWAIRTNSKNILIQMNQPEIKKNTKELAEIIRTGDKKKLSYFIDSEKSIYIPKLLRKKIKKILNNELNDLDTKCIDHMLSLINKYIT